MDKKEILKKRILKEFKGYEGFEIYNIEFPIFEKLVLLCNLRDLFYKELPDLVLSVEYDYIHEKQELKEKLPFYYDKFFVEEHEILNVSKIKKQYKDYFDYIINLNQDNHIYYSIKEKYSEIYQLIHENLFYLIEIRRIIEYTEMNKQEDFSIQIAKEMLTKTGFGEIFKDSLKSKDKISKIIWKKSIIALKSVIKDLSKYRYIDFFEETFLYQHFIIDFKNEFLREYENYKPQKLNWINELEFLAFFINELLKEGIISLQKKQKNKITTEHFTWNEKEIDSDSLRTSRYNVKQDFKNHDTDKYLEISSLIKHIKNIK